MKMIQRKQGTGSRGRTKISTDPIKHSEPHRVWKGLTVRDRYGRVQRRFAWRGTRLTETRDGLQSLCFEHDAAGRLTRETLRPAGEPPADIPTGPGRK